MNERLQQIVAHLDAAREELEHAYLLSARMQHDSMEEIHDAMGCVDAALQWSRACLSWKTQQVESPQ